MIGLRQMTLQPSSIHYQYKRQDIYLLQHTHSVMEHSEFLALVASSNRYQMTICRINHHRQTQLMEILLMESVSKSIHTWNIV